MTTAVALAASPGQECEERVGPLEVAARIDEAVVLGSRLVAGEEAAEGEEPLMDQARGVLASVEEMLDGCVDGPVPRSDLAAWHFSMGVLDMLMGVPGEQNRNMTAAYNVGGHQVLDDRYGEEVLAPFDEAAGVLLGKGTLDLSFSTQPDELHVDGRQLSEGGRRMVNATRHLVQWRTGDEWHGAFVEIEVGGELQLGDGGGTREEEQEEVVNRFAVRRRPRIDPRGTVEFSGLYGAAMATLGDHSGAIRGGLGLPGASVQSRLVLYDHLVIRVQAIGGAAIFTDAPDLVSRFSTTLGAEQKLGSIVWRATVGPVVLPLAELSGGAIDKEFRNTWALGVEAGSSLAVGPLEGGLRFSWVERQFSFGGSARVLLGSLDEKSSPFVRATIEGSSRAGVSIHPDTTIGALLEGGVVWSF